MHLQTVAVHSFESFEGKTRILAQTHDMVHCLLGALSLSCLYWSTDQAACEQFILDRENLKYQKPWTKHGI